MGKVKYSRCNRPSPTYTSAHMPSTSHICSLPEAISTLRSSPSYTPVLSTVWMWSRTERTVGSIRSYSNTTTCLVEGHRCLSVQRGVGVAIPFLSSLLSASAYQFLAPICVLSSSSTSESSLLPAPAKLQGQERKQAVGLSRFNSGSSKIAFVLNNVQLHVKLEKSLNLSEPVSFYKHRYRTSSDTTFKPTNVQWRWNEQIQSWRSYSFCRRVPPNSSLLISEDRVKNGIPCSRVNWVSHRQSQGGPVRGIPAPSLEEDPRGREPPGSKTRTFTEDIAQHPVLLSLIPLWRTKSYMHHRNKYFRIAKAECCCWEAG